jgi:hypothetical protein
VGLRAAVRRMVAVRPMVVMVMAMITPYQHKYLPRQ